MDRKSKIALSFWKRVKSLLPLAALLPAASYATLLTGTLNNVQLPAGNYEIKSVVTVPLGSTVGFSPSSQLTFSGQGRLIVNGTLNANGLGVTDLDSLPNFARIEGNLGANLSFKNSGFTSMHGLIMYLRNVNKLILEEVSYRYCSSMLLNMYSDLTAPSTTVRINQLWAEGNSGGMDFWTIKDVEITNSVFNHFRSYGVPQIRTENVGRMLIESTIFSRAYVSGSDRCGRPAASVIDGRHMVLKNVILDRNTSVGGPSIRLYGNDSILNATMVGNQNEHLIEVFGPAKATIINSVSYGNDTRGKGEIYSSELTGGTGTATVSSSFFERTAYPGIKMNQISTLNPRFRDETAGDYIPVPGSPMIDGGIDYPGLPVTDFDGQPRKSGVRVNIGAYESVSAPSEIKLQCYNDSYYGKKCIIPANGNPVALQGFLDGKASSTVYPGSTSGTVEVSLQGILNSLHPETSGKDVFRVEWFGYYGGRSGYAWVPAR